jgi:membrane protein DedA with SNARE-associated domain
MVHLDIAQWLLNYRYLILFPLAVLEGPIVTVTAGLMSSLGLMNFYIVYVVVVAGDLVGDGLYYAVGRWGLRPLERWGKYIGIHPEKLNQVEKHFADHGGKTLIAAKLSHAVGGIVLVSAGIARIPFKKFIFFNFWATLPKSLVLILIGYYFGNTYIKLQKFVDFAWLGTFAIAILLFVIYMFLRRAGKKLSGE